MQYFILSILLILAIYQSILLRKIAKKFGVLNFKIENLERTDKEMALDFTELAQDVTDLTTAEAGAEAVLTALVIEVETLAANQEDPTAQEQLNNFASQLKGSIGKLSAAVANVPAKDLPPVAAPVSTTPAGSSTDPADTTPTTTTTTTTPVADPATPVVDPSHTFTGNPSEIGGPFTPTT